MESNVGYGMKWHRVFCIALFITAAASIAHGVLYFIGKGEYQWLYDLGIESGVFPDGKIVTYIVGIITFICAPLALIARHKLAEERTIVFQYLPGGFRHKKYRVCMYRYSDI